MDNKQIQTLNTKNQLSQVLSVSQAAILDFFRVTCISWGDNQN